MIGGSVRSSTTTCSWRSVLVVHHNSNLIDGDRHFGGVVVGGCRDAPRAGASAAGIAAKCRLPYSPEPAGGSHQLPNSEPIQIKLCSEFRERVKPPTVAHQ